MFRVLVLLCVVRYWDADFRGIVVELMRVDSYCVANVNCLGVGGCEVHVTDNNTVAHALSLATY